MKFTSTFVASLGLLVSYVAAQSANDARVVICEDGPGASPTETGYEVVLLGIQTDDLCSICDTVFSEVAPAMGVTVDSYQCVENVAVNPISGAEYVIEVALNGTNQNVTDAAFVASVSQCAGTVQFVCNCGGVATSGPNLDQPDCIGNERQ